MSENCNKNCQHECTYESNCDNESPAPAQPEASPKPQALEDSFWGWCEENAVNGALRIDDKWRVDDVAVQFAAYHAAAQNAALTKEVERMRQELANLKANSAHDAMAKQIP